MLKRRALSAFMTLSVLATAVTGSVAAENAALRAVFDGLPGGHGGRTAVTFLGAEMDAWVARWRLVSEATTTIHTTTWAMTRDVFALAYLGLLLEKAQAGVRVELMLDGRGSSGLVMPLKGRDYLQELVATGNAAVRVYNPLVSTAAPTALLSGDLLALWASNHDKIIEADGRQVITGGRNIAGYYFRDRADDFEVYRDADVLVADEAVVRAMLTAFHAEFEAKAAKPVGKDSFGDWHDRSGELLWARHLMEWWLQAPPCDEALVDRLRVDDGARAAEATAIIEAVSAALAARGVVLPKTSDAAVRRMAEELVAAPLLRGRAATEAGQTVAGVDLRVLDRPALVNPDVPDTANDNLEALVGAARRSIVMANPYFVLTKRSLAAFEAAARRGVTITLLTNGPKAGSSGLTQAHFVRWWAEELARIPTLRIFVFDDEHVKIHGKVAVFDDVVTVVGSYNIDLVSARVNSEIVTVSWSSEFAVLGRRYVEELIEPGPERVVEYRIRRDGSGRAVRDDAGAVVVEFGPEQHCTPETMAGVRNQQKKLDLLRRMIPGLRDLL